MLSPKALRVTGRVTESIELYEQVVDWRRKSQGANHRYTVRDLGRLAHAYALGGCLDRAAKTREELVRAEKVYYGTGRNTDGLAKLYEQLGDAKAVARTRFQLRTNHYDRFSRSHVKVIKPLKEIRDLDEAESVMRQALGRMTNGFGAAHPEASHFGLFFDNDVSRSLEERLSSWLSASYTSRAEIREFSRKTVLAV